MNKTKAYIAATSYSIIVGLSLLMTKVVISYSNSLLILSHRFLFAFTAYLSYIILSKKKLKIGFLNTLKMLPVLAFYPIIFFGLQTVGLNYSKSSEGGIIFATVPIITILIETLLGHPPSKRKIVFSVVSVTGVLIIFSQSILSINLSSIVGLSLLLLSTLSFAIYMILVKNVLAKVGLHELTLMITLVGFLSFNLMFAWGNMGSSYLKIYFAPFSSPMYLIGILYLGIVASVLASLFSNYALQFIKASSFSVFSNLSTMVSILSGVIILNETLSINHIIGIPTILIGVIGVNSSDHKK